MLARNSDLEGAATAIRSLEKQFNRWFQYHIIFLNDQPWEQDFISALTAASSASLSFEIIPPSMWSYPAHIDQPHALKCMAAQKAKGLPYADLESYHHMCRFNSGPLFSHPALLPYDWYWRIEPDVTFTCAITYDPFRFMRQHNKTYGYTIALWEVGSTCPSIFRTTTTYREAHLSHLSTSPLWTSMLDASWAPLPLRRLLMPHLLHSRDRKGDAWNFCHFWSNFEIASLAFFRSDAYRAYFEALDAAGGFYYERWGDAPVHSLAAAMLLEPRQVHWFRDFGYSHPPFQQCPRNAVRAGQLPGSEVLGTGSWNEETQQVGGIGCRCECDPDVGRVPSECIDRLRQSVDIE